MSTLQPPPPPSPIASPDPPSPLLATASAESESASPIRSQSQSQSDSDSATLLGESESRPPANVADSAESDGSDESAEVSPSPPRLVASIHLKYSPTEKRFFSPAFPPELEGLISNYVYSKRIGVINKDIGNMLFLRDYTPIWRTVLIFFFSAFSIILAFLKVNGNSMGTWVVVFLCIVFLISLSYYKSFKCDRVVNAHLEKFTKEDTHIKLKWSLTKAPPSPFLTLSWTKAQAEVPRTIEIRYIKLHSDECEFLPAYSPEYTCCVDMTNEENGEIPLSVTRCPSYRTIALNLNPIPTPASAPRVIV
ncbi:hypothetical protein HDU79_000633 [Rhizoclosmatium sp. JEL0117]|nr:hypothetical protein HDU79_000633 [Rhizoclosmatium sp. JEL0117]